MLLKSIRLDYLTLFHKLDLQFVPGVNVFLGANSTGKTHLLKLIFATIKAGEVPSPEDAGQAEKTHPIWERLRNVFKPAKNLSYRLTTQIRTNRLNEQNPHPSTVRLETDQGCAGYQIHTSAISDITKDYPKFNSPAGLFIPPSEVLSISDGFISAYEKRELPFDETYYHLCKALGPWPLKQVPEFYQNVVGELEAELGGTITRENGGPFYLSSGLQHIESSMLAEGYKKLGTLLYLLRNGSLTPGMILLWDEPESSLNPRLVTFLALILRKLAESGIQVFVATHDYLLTGELSNAAEYQTTPNVPIRFFCFSRENPEASVVVQSGGTLADLEENPILEEFAAHYDRELKLYKTVVSKTRGE